MSMEKRYTKRELEIIRWRSEGKTQAYIARELGVTRQRVQQIEKKLDLNPRRAPGEYKTYPFVCETCGKQTESKSAGRKFCSRACFYESRKAKMSKSEREAYLLRRREKNRLRAKYYYHFVFKNKKNWQEIVKQRNEQQARKLKNK